jgi:hypothetical protein
MLQFMNTDSRTNIYTEKKRAKLSMITIWRVTMQIHTNCG